MRAGQTILRLYNVIVDWPRDQDRLRGEVMHKLMVIAIAAALSGAAFVADPPKPRAGDLKVGDAAPAFELKQLGAEKPVKLAGLSGKPVVLVFGSCT